MVVIVDIERYWCVFVVRQLWLWTVPARSSTSVSGSTRSRKGSVAESFTFKGEMPLEFDSQWYGNVINIFRFAAWKFYLDGLGCGVWGGGVG